MATNEVEAEQRAWDLFKSIVGNEQFYSFYNLGQPLQLTGSAGGAYKLFPSGKIESSIKGSGKIFQRNKKYLPIADIFVTAYLWITANEISFLGRWGCGNIVVNSYGTEILSADFELNIFDSNKINCLLSCLLNSGVSNSYFKEFIGGHWQDISCNTKVMLKDKVFTSCPVCGCLYFYVAETQKIIYNFRNPAVEPPLKITDINVLKHYLNLLREDDDPLVNLILKYKS